MDDVKRENQEQMEREQIRRQVEERIKEEALAYPSKSQANGNGKVSSQYLEKCLYSNQLGMGLLYSALLKDKLIYNNSGAEWLRWAGHTWDHDIMQTSYAATEDIVDRLLEEISTLTDRIGWAVKKDDKTQAKELRSKQDLIYKRIATLREDRGRNACLKFARTCREPIAIKGDELDLDPMLLGCANGVIDLRTGECEPGRADQFISKASSVEWRSLSEPAPKFSAWIREVLSEDDELVAFLQRALGYAITGLVQEHVLLVLHGAGRNGKGTLVELMGHVLGPLAGPIQAEMLLDQGRARNSAGPSPDIMGLRGLRIAFASETDEDRKFSPSRVKWLTGGDQLVGRHPHDKYEIRFDPTHTLILLTNHKPSAPDTDFAFWERVRLVPFKLAFVDREPSAANERRAKKGLAAELKEEASGILAWLVRGYLAYRERGLDPPLAVAEATADWKKAENEILDFIEDYCSRDEMAKIKSTILYENFNRWFKANRSRKGVSQSMFGRIMGKRFGKKKVEGTIYYVGLDLIKEVPIPEDEEKDGYGKDGDLF
jgi:putative DNA primase/helicase